MSPLRIFAKLLIGAMLLPLPVYADKNPVADKQTPAADKQAAAPADKPPAPISNKPLTQASRFTLIRGLEAEFVYIRRTLPISEKGVVVKNGTVTPDGAELRAVVAQTGAAGHPGDRGQITNVVIGDHDLVFEINGGPKKKTKWYQHISVGMGGAEMPVGGANDSTMAHGAKVILAFDKFVPDLTVDQVKQLLTPVFDFSSKSAVQAYEQTLPPKVQEAVKNHQVLVGMDRDMVTTAKGRPDQKVREREDTTDYEEWIYGQPPAEVSFVRFVGDEVVQVKTMTVDGKKIVKTEKEVDMKADAAMAAKVAKDGAAGGSASPTAASDGQDTAKGTQASAGGPTKKPTLRRPGEEVPSPDDIQTTAPDGRVPYPTDPNGQRRMPSQSPLPPTPPPTTGLPPPTL
jgi:hypothetical protein